MLKLFYICGLQVGINHSLDSLVLQDSTEIIFTL